MPETFTLTLTREQRDVLRAIVGSALDLDSEAFCPDALGELHGIPGAAAIIAPVARELDLLTPFDADALDVERANAAGE